MTGLAACGATGPNRVASAGSVQGWGGTGARQRRSGSHAVGGLEVGQQGAVGSGIGIEGQDDNGFADSVLQCLRNPAEAKRMGRNGREFVRENFLITRLLLNYLQVLDEIV